MKVRRFFLRLLPRLGIFVLSVLLLSVLTFYISRLAPGDPLVSYYGDREAPVRASHASSRSCAAGSGRTPRSIRS